MTSERFKLHPPTLILLCLLGAALLYANIVPRRHVFGSIRDSGWPLTTYSDFYGIESFDWWALPANCAIATLILAATGWVIETWSRQGFRLSIASLLGMTAVAALLALCINCGVVCWSSVKAPGEESDFALYFAAVSRALIGKELTFDMYGEYWWEYVPFAVLFLGIAFTLYAAGRILLLPFRILSHGPFRWR